MMETVLPINVYKIRKKNREFVYVRMAIIGLREFVRSVRSMRILMLIGKIVFVVLGFLEVRESVLGVIRAVGLVAVLGPINVLLVLVIYICSKIKSVSKRALKMLYK